MSSEYSEVFRAMMRDQQEETGRRYARLVIRQLDLHQVSYRLDPETGDAVITTRSGLIDFWTTTGHWFDRRSQQRGRGFDTLLKRIEGDSHGAED